MEESWKEVELQHGHQVAVIPGYKRSVSVMLLEGEAEIFGMLLKPNERCCFAYPYRTVVATFDGCRMAFAAENFDLEVQIIKDDPFPGLVGCMHAILTKQRQEAVESKGETAGPRAIIVGPMDSGKSSCCRTLLNYAVADGWNPTFVDLDAGQQGLTFPGSISSAILRSTVNCSGTLENAVQVDLPFGRVKLDEDTELYKAQIRKLAEFVTSSFSNPHLGASGLMINTAGWIDKNGFVVLLEIAKAFGVDKVFVLENAQLGHQFQKWALDGNIPLEVLFARKPICLAERPIETRRDYRDCIVQNGFLHNDHHICVVPLSKLIFYQLASFHAVELKNGRKLGVGNQIVSAVHCRDRLLGISIAHNLEVDVKQFPLQGFAVLLSFQSKIDEARLICTIDLNLLPGPIILLRTEVSAVTLRETVDLNVRVGG